MGDSDLHAERDQLADMLRQLWLYVDWRYCTKQLPTAQKEIWAQIIERHWNEDGPGADGEPPLRADRWWLCPTCGDRITNGKNDGPHVGCMWAEEAPGS